MPTILCLYLFSAMFLPHFGHARPEYVFLLLLLIPVLRGGLGHSPLAGVRTDVVLLGLMVISGMISIVAYNATHAGSVFHWRDLMSIVGYPTYAVMIVATANVALDSRGKKTLSRYIGFAALLASLISIVQFFDIGGLNRLFLELYRSADDDIYFRNFVLDYGNRRVFGTAGNPNNWGFALTMLGLIVMARVVYHRHLTWVPHLVLILVSILMTGSRTALLGFMLGAVVIVAIGVQMGRARGGTVATALFAVLLIPIVFAVYTAQVDERQGAERFSSKQIGSLIMRFELWTATIEEYSSDMFIGRGPSKAARRKGFEDAESFHVRDNIFVSVFAQFGVVGLSLLFGFFVAQGSKLYRYARLSPPQSLFYSIGAVGVFVAWALYNTAADAFFALHPTHNFLGVYGAAIAWARPALAPAEQPASAEEDVDAWRSHEAGQSVAAGNLRS